MPDNETYGKTRSGGRISGRKPTLPGAYEAGRYSFAPWLLRGSPIPAFLLTTARHHDGRLYAPSQGRAPHAERATRVAEVGTRPAGRTRHARPRDAVVCAHRRFSRIVVRGWLPGRSGRVLRGGARRRPRLPAVGPQRPCRHHRRGDARAIATPARGGRPASVGRVGQVASKVYTCGLARAIGDCC